MKHDLLENYLRVYRRRAGLSQEDVALLLGLASKSTVSAHEQGHQAPSLETALGYAVVLGVPVHELFTRMFQEVEEGIISRALSALDAIQEDLDSTIRPRKVESLARIGQTRESIIVPVCQD